MLFLFSNYTLILCFFLEVGVSVAYTPDAQFFVIQKTLM
jgi:hypothetical protein